ncbi:MAG: hypothetical protein P1V33_01385 [Pseudohongiella nitratireducens]|nr:hypothetical protein [Pseudohongiella nitratireducens]MDF1622107.1 hypothetical protein [Pseudohongiella nitratireducens]
MQTPASMQQLSQRLQSTPSWLLFLICSGILYLSLFPLLSWGIFTEDDSHIMRVALDYGPILPWFDAARYQELSVANFTPLPLSLYYLLSQLFPMRPLFFVLFMLGMLTIVSTLTALLVQRLSASKLSGLASIVLLFSCQTTLTLASRFYTMHYLVGAVFALLAVLLCYRQALTPLRIGGLMLLALLAMASKEVYVMLLPLLVYLAWHQYRAGRETLQLLGGLLVTFLIYWLWRSVMLGGSPALGQENSYFAGFWNIPLAAWASFLIWYVQTHYLLLLTALILLILNPRTVLSRLPLALMFALPGLAVTHGIVDHTMHADRIFFAMNTGLVVVIAASLGPVLARIAERRQLGVASVVLLAVSVAGQASFAASYRQVVTERADYRITRYILDRAPALAQTTVLLPMNYIQGDLMRVASKLERPWPQLTQNCELALAREPENMIAFDDQGALLERAVLTERCSNNGPVPQIDQEPQFSEGILSWSMNPPPGFTAGVLFIDRAFAVPLPQFASQLVRPAPGERYQVFATNWQQWWFGEPAVIAGESSQEIE